MTKPELWGPLASRYATPGARKMLALDGGGSRGVLTLRASVSPTSAPKTPAKWTKPTATISISC
jgi:hypothetical protein